MSGPYCETCKHYFQPPLSHPDRGECDDRAKVIYDRNGNRVNGAPEVHGKYTCCNHTLKSDPAADT